MGLAYGKLQFNDSKFNYNYIKNYCIDNQIQLVSDDPEHNLLSTRTIKKLRVLKESNIEVRGLGNQISGMDSDGYEISIEGIAYPFYEEEFPHHVKEYNEMFIDK